TFYLLISLFYISPVFGQNPKQESFRAPLHFTKMKVSSETYESVGVFDVNNDGHPDLVSGAFWYEGPRFIQRHFITVVKRVEEYWYDFSTIPLDVKGDGNVDFISGGWFGATLHWFENPGTNGKWKAHIIDETGNIETARGWDIDGDGTIEIFPNN